MDDHLIVKAEWIEDEWIAESEDLPGLVIGADTLDELMYLLKVVVPELLEANSDLVPNMHLPVMLKTPNTMSSFVSPFG